MLCINIFENSLFTSFIFPLIIAVLTTVIMKKYDKKKDNAELDKLKSDTTKNEEEINKIKTSYQPIVLNSLQTIQSELFKDKVNSLKELIKSKSDIFNVKQTFHEGNAIIEDTHDYYQNIYLGLSDFELKNVETNSLNNGYLFPSDIRNKFQELVRNLNEVYDIQKREMSIQNQSMPDGVEDKMKNISAIYDDLIELIRKDLHFDNTFIHDFIKAYQK